MALRRAASLMTLLAKQAAEEETDPGSADRRRHSRPDELQFRDDAVTANEYAANPSQGDAIIGTPPPQQSATFDHRAWQRHLKRQYQRLKQLPDETPRQALAQRGGEAGGGGGDSSSDSDDSRNDKQVTTAQQDATAEAAGASPSPSGPAIDMTETDEQVIKRTASGRTTSYWRFREWEAAMGSDNDSTSNSIDGSKPPKPERDPYAQRRSSDSSEGGASTEGLHAYVEASEEPDFVPRLLRARKEVAARAEAMRARRRRRKLSHTLLQPPSVKPAAVAQAAAGGPQPGDKGVPQQQQQQQQQQQPRAQAPTSKPSPATDSKSPPPPSSKQASAAVTTAAPPPVFEQHMDRFSTMVFTDTRNAPGRAKHPEPYWRAREGRLQRQISEHCVSRRGIKDDGASGTRLELSGLAGDVALQDYFTSHIDLGDGRVMTVGDYVASTTPQLDLGVKQRYAAAPREVPAEDKPDSTIGSAASRKAQAAASRTSSKRSSPSPRRKQQRQQKRPTTAPATRRTVSFSSTAPAATARAWDGTSRTAAHKQESRTHKPVSVFRTYHGAQSPPPRESAVTASPPGGAKVPKLAMHRIRRKPHHKRQPSSKRRPKTATTRRRRGGTSRRSRPASASATSRSLRHAQSTQRLLQYCASEAPDVPPGDPRVKRKLTPAQRLSQGLTARPVDPSSLSFASTAALSRAVELVAARSAEAAIAREATYKLRRATVTSSADFERLSRENKIRALGRLERKHSSTERRFMSEQRAAAGRKQRETADALAVALRKAQQGREAQRRRAKTAEEAAKATAAAAAAEASGAGGAGALQVGAATMTEAVATKQAESESRRARQQRTGSEGRGLQGGKRQAGLRSGDSGRRSTVAAAAGSARVGGGPRRRMTRSRRAASFAEVRRLTASRAPAQPTP